jgi:hypothetical protein
MLALLKDGMYAQKNIDPKLRPDVQLLIRELNTYDRTVNMIHTLPGKLVFYVNPSYDGKDTIEIEYNLDSTKNLAKQLRKAIDKIRSIPEFEAFQDERTKTKAQLLAKFCNKYVPSKNGRLDFLRGIYRRGSKKIPDDFLEFYGDLMGLASSNFVPPDQLKKMIKIYEKKSPDQRIILPRVDEYRVVDPDDIKVLELEDPLFVDINFVSMIKGDNFTMRLEEEFRKEFKEPKEKSPESKLTDLEKDLTPCDESRTPDLGLHNMEESLKDPE